MWEANARETKHAGRGKEETHDSCGSSFAARMQRICQITAGKINRHFGGRTLNAGAERFRNRAKQPDILALSFLGDLQAGGLGRSKNVVSIVQKRGKKRIKEEKQRGKQLARFCVNSSAPFGLA